MKVKNLNPVERHVEKVVLGVAALAGAWLAYDAVFNPVTAKDQKTTAGQVEQAVSNAVKDWQTRVDKANRSPAKPFPTVSGAIDYPGDKPLPPALLNQVAAFYPKQVGGTPRSQGPDVGPAAPTAIASPLIPPLKDFAVATNRGVVILNPPMGPNPQPVQPAALKTDDKRWVRGDARLDMLDLLKGIGRVDLDPAKSLPLQAQRTTIGALDVERREHNADGSWTDWKSVATNPFQPEPSFDLKDVDDAHLGEILNQVDKDLPNIVNPNYYPLATPTVTGAEATPVRKPLTPDEQLRLIQEAERTLAHGEAAGAAHPGAKSPTATPRPTPPRPTGTPHPTPTPTPRSTPAGTPTPNPLNPLNPLRPGMGAGEGGPDGPMPFEDGPGFGGPRGPGPLHQNDTIEQLKKNPVPIPVWFYDDTVQSGKEYQYRVRLKAYNPAYRITLPLEDAKLKDQPWLFGPWVEAPANGTIRIEPDQYFFLTRNTLGVGNTTSAIIYQWAGGRWEKTEEVLRPGIPVGQSKTIPGHTGEQPKTVNFGTGFTVVDVRPDPADPSNGNTRVVLMDPNGQLTTRDIMTDQNNPKRKDLDNAINGHAAAGGVSAATGL